MGKSIVAVILTLLLALNLVYADDVSQVLRLYGYYEPVDIEKVQIELNKLLDEYYTLSKEVSGIEMTQIATTISEEQHPSLLAMQEKKVVEQETELKEIEGLILNSSEVPVEELLSLESKYLKIEKDLENSKIQLDKLKKEKPEIYNEDYNVKQLKAELSRKDTKVKTQKSIVIKAATFPVIGDSRIKKYPLEASSYVTSDFGKRIDPISKEATQFHTGIDLYANINTKVTCAYNGTAEKVGFNEELGNYVIVDHGKGLNTIYGHLNSYIVNIGDSISQYQHIAYSGNSGSRSTGPHLHFGVYIYGKPVNPIVIVKR